MGFFSDLGNAAKDFASSITSGRGQDRGRSNNRVSGNSMRSSPRPRARPNVRRVDESDDDFRARQQREGAATISLGGNSFTLPANQNRPTMNRNVTGRADVTGSRSSRSRTRTSGPRGQLPGRTERSDVIEGIGQPVGRGRAVSRRIESETPQRGSSNVPQRRAASRFRRTGQLGGGQRPLLPITTASRTLKALTGQ